MLPVDIIRNDFPLLTAKPDLVYLDSTATSLKPQTVIKALTRYYTDYSANIHRGIYEISEEATKAYEDSRQQLARFINASTPDEVIFIRNATEGMNIIAERLLLTLLHSVKGKATVVTSIAEHHANFIPWQQAAKKAGAGFVVLPIQANGHYAFLENDGSTINKDELEKYITHDTVLFAFSAASNVLGTITPVAAVTAAVKELNPKTIVVVDAAQAAPHLPIDVQHWGADFIAFSGHKMLGPTGIGVLWGTYEHLDRMEPYQYGGDMIERVTVEKTTFRAPPGKFEAGTPAIADAIALGEAARYLQMVNLTTIHEYEKALAHKAIKAITETFGERIRILGTVAPERTGIVSFVHSKYHAHDIAQILSDRNIAVRAGHHCTMPLHTALEVTASVRASFYLYNTEADIEALIEGLQTVEKILG